MAVLKATRRDERGTHKARRLRKQGLIPGVIYGHGQQTDAVTLSEHDVELAILHGERLLEVELDGQTQNVLIKDVQYDTFGRDVLHVDLTRVDLDELVEVTVAIALKGTPAGVTEEGGVLQQISAEASIKCPVRAIPEQIVAMVGDMKVGDILTMGGLQLPEGAELLTDPAIPVASVRIVAEEVEAPAAVEAVAEPEVIGEKKEAEEEESPAKE